MSEILHIYTRVSTSAQEDDGTSLETQRKLGTKQAKDLGMQAKVWNEGGQSSKHDDLGNRSVLAALLTEIEAGNLCRRRLNARKAMQDHQFFAWGRGSENHCWSNS